MALSLGSAISLTHTHPLQTSTATTFYILLTRHWTLFVFDCVMLLMENLAWSVFGHHVPPEQRQCALALILQVSRL